MGREVIKKPQKKKKKKKKKQNKILPPDSNISSPTRLISFNHLLEWSLAQKSGN